MHLHQTKRRRAFEASLFHGRRLFKDPDPDPANGGGGGAPDPVKVAAEKAAADAKAAADKATTDAKAAADKLAAATTADKVAAEKAAADAKKAAEDATAKAGEAQKALDKIVADAKKAADDAKAAADKLAAADPEDETVHQLKNKDFKKIKEQAARKALEQTAREAGFASPEDMVAAAKKAGNPTASETDKKLEQLTAGQKKLEGELHQERLRAKVREAAISAGFMDPNYAEFLASGHIAGKDAAAQLGTDFGAFFTGLKTTQAHLFRTGADGKPVTTGNAGAGQPGAQGADKSIADAAGGKVKDATKLTPAEFQAELQRRWGVQA